VSIFKYFVTLLLPMSLYAQTKINEKVQGDLWRTARVSGEVAISHIWGRSVVMPVKDAWVNIVGDRIEIGARTDSPVIDGKVRSGYHMFPASGTLQMEEDEYSSHEYDIQTITSKGVYGIDPKDEDNVILGTATAVIHRVKGAPISLVYTYTDYANFDVRAYIEARKNSKDFFERQSIEFLEGFNDQRFRTRTFTATHFVQVFDE
jgi:hypothetical protein